MAQIVDEDEVKVTSVFKSLHEHAVVEKDATLDEITLGALGYKQEFKRDFSIWQSFSVSFSVLGLLPSVASTITYCLGFSGTGGSVWGWLASALMIQSSKKYIHRNVDKPEASADRSACVFLAAFSMAELCSSMPTAGGLYYASAVLAPEGWGPIASWFVGWSNFCGVSSLRSKLQSGKITDIDMYIQFVTGPCSVNYALAAMLITCGEIAYPDSYVAKTWHIYLILVALLIVQGLITMQSTKFIGHVNVAGTVFNIIVVIIFVIWFPVGSINSPKTNNSHAVWTTFENGTEWPIGWSTIMGKFSAFISSMQSRACFTSRGRS